MTNLRTVGKTQYETPESIANAMREAVEALIKRGVVTFLAFAELYDLDPESTPWVGVTVPYSSSLMRGLAADLYDFVESRREQQFTKPDEDA